MEPEHIDAAVVCAGPAGLAAAEALVEAGPDPEIDGVVRWRRIDLKRWIAAQFGVVMHERTGGRATGGARLSAAVSASAAPEGRPRGAGGV